MFATQEWMAQQEAIPAKATPMPTPQYVAPTYTYTYRETLSDKVDEQSDKIDELQSTIEDLQTKIDDLENR
jgi:hypothetical protein